MNETRRLRLQSVLQQELSRLISREVRDHRVPPLTITQVVVTADGSQATISVAILGGAQGGHGDNPLLSEAEATKRIKDCLAGLASSSGFLRRELASLLEIRHIPTLIFREDRGFENVFRVGELLNQIKSSPSVPESDSNAADTSDKSED